MHEFAEEYVANLQARDERYDTRLGDDFYVSTFPNGVKTWIYLYEVNGFNRRQTLGVYPEMPLEAALESLYVARRTRSVEKDLMEQGLDGAGMTREAEDSPVDLTAFKAKRKRPLPKIDFRFAIGGLAGGALTAILGVGIFFIVQPDNEESAEPARFASTATQRRVDSEPVPMATRQSASAADTAVAEPTAPVSATAQQLQADEQAGDELSPTQLELIRMQQDMTGTLAWSQLTSGIVRGEPVDNLGWIVEVADKPMRVFFFVRVRGMSGATVQYHWHHEGELIKQDSVRVGDGWHSPAFSSVILDSAREGQWRVEVLDEAGQSLGAEQFEARSPGTAVLSQR